MKKAPLFSLFALLLTACTGYSNEKSVIENGVEIFVEIGNGKVLSGLNKKISSDIISYNVYDKATCIEVAEKLKEVL